jgi:hypothetical protein
LYRRAKIVHDSIIETNGDFSKIYMSFRYLDDEEEERIIDVELNLVAILKNKTMWLDIKIQSGKEFILKQLKK